MNANPWLWLVPLTALVAGALTLVSGFGLNTLLLPVMLLFYPGQTAILLTAVVHLLNNIFKFALVGRHIRWDVALRFGLPAVVAAALGAWLLAGLAAADAVLYRLEWGSYASSVTRFKVVLGLLIGIFALWDLLPALNKLALHPRYLPLGGLMSGFFGGLSGHQGAIRSAFLVRMNLPPLVFVATGVSIALAIDFVRIAGYVPQLGRNSLWDVPLGWGVATVLAAFLGSYVGSLLIRKTTLKGVQWAVGVCLLLLSVAMLLGFV
jgi:uncharacterized protein